MKPSHATAEVFWTAFTVLPDSEKNLFLKRLFKDEPLLSKTELLDDLIDLSIAKERSEGEFVSLDEFLKGEGY